MSNPVKPINPETSSLAPKQGDVVIPLAGYHIGAHALICHHPDVEDDHVYIGYHVTGNKVPGEFDAVSCSGGPFSDVPVSELTLIGTKMQSFLDSRVLRGPNRYDKYFEEVNVWAWTPVVDEEICLGRSFDTYQEYWDAEESLLELYSEYRNNCVEVSIASDNGQGREIMRGNHLVCGVRHRFSQDQIVEAMFSSYRANKMISLYKARHADAGYLYKDEQLGIWVYSEAEMQALIEAYHLTDAVYDEEIRTYRFTPNLNIESWMPLRVERTKQAV